MAEATPAGPPESPATMALTLRLPAGALFEGAARRIVARGPDGGFGLLPRHADFVSPLTAGVVTVERADGSELFFGVDEGVLVKAGREVRVCVRRAFRAATPAEVRDRVAEAFAHPEDRERAAHTALARLEAGAARRFAQLTGQPR